MNCWILFSVSREDLCLQSTGGLAKVTGHPGLTEFDRDWDYFHWGVTPHENSQDILQGFSPCEFKLQSVSFPSVCGKHCSITWPLSLPLHSQVRSNHRHRLTCPNFLLTVCFTILFYFDSFLMLSNKYTLYSLQLFFSFVVSHYTKQPLAWFV